MYLLKVRRDKEGTVHVKDMLADGLHADAPFTGLGQYLQYLLVVSQGMKYDENS